MQNPRTRLIGCVFAAIILLLVGLPVFGQDTQPGPVTSQSLGKAIEQMDAIDSTIATRRSTAPSEIVNRLDQIPPAPRLSEALGPKFLAFDSQPLSEADRTKLLKAITGFSSHTQSESRLFTFWAIIFIAASALFALAGGILSFLKKNIWAGVLGLVVTAVIAFSNAYPFNELSAFYGSLHAQTESLRTECELKEPFTANAYSAESKQLTLLILSEAKRPGFGNYKVPAEDVTQDVEKVKAAANTIERENAFAQGTVMVKAQAKPETRRILVSH